MAGFMDGKKKQSGGNVQREKFGYHAGGGGKAMPEDRKVKGDVGVGDSPTDNGDGATTTITHHGDGTHSVEHADGEKTDHPTTGHMLMTMHAKHTGEPGGHIHAHGAGATTHHVGHDGMVEGPHEHGTTEEAADHMKAMLGEDGGNGAMEMSDGMQPSMHQGAGPTLY